MDDAMYRLHAEFEESYWWFVAKNRILLSLIERYLPPPRTPAAPRDEPVRRPRALDIGCGTGGLLSRLAARFDAVGVDMSPTARDYCAKRGLTTIDGSLPDNLPFDPASFDLIVATEVLEHVERDAASVATLVRLLKPGGLLVCTVPAHPWMWSRHDEINHHYRRYTRPAFRALFEDHPLTTEVLSYYMITLFPVMAAARLAANTAQRRTPRDAGRDSHAEPSVKPLPRPVNALLRALFESEKHLLPFASSPLGSSLISVHRKAPMVTTRPIRPTLRPAAATA